MFEPPTKFLVGRKVIQICHFEDGSDRGLYALCNDGTMWLFKRRWKRAEWRHDWEQFMPVPQDVVKEEYTHGDVG